MDEEKKKNNDLWKAVALIVVGILIGIFFGMKVLSALDWGLDKTTTCNLLNKTGVACEIFWCNNINGGNYSLTKEICVFSEVINQTIYVNDTNYTGNYSGNFTCNESWIAEIVRNETLSILNNKSFVNESVLIATKNSILEMQDNDTRRIIKEEYPRSSSNNNFPTATPMPGWVWVFAIGMVCALIGFLVWNKGKNQEKKEIYDEDRDRRTSNKRSSHTDKKYISRNLPKAKQEEMRKKVEEEARLQKDNPNEEEFGEQISEDEEEEETR